MSDAWFAFGVVLSLVVHASLVRGVESIEPVAIQQHTTDTLEWVSLPPPEPEPEPDPEPEVQPEPEPEPLVRPVRRVAQRAPAPAETEQAPASPESAAPVDLTGVTLSAGSGGWAPAGNGQAGGPIRAPRQGRVRAEEPVEAAGPAMVAVGDLSRPPDPPNLDSRLLEQYPETARRQGIPGNALVRARVLPTGRVDRLRVVSASSPRFAQACRAVLRGSRWSAPLDRGGNPVATEIRYRCQFQVR